MLGGNSPKIDVGTRGAAHGCADVAGLSTLLPVQADTSKKADGSDLRPRTTSTFIFTGQSMTRFLRPNDKVVIEGPASTNRAYTVASVHHAFGFELTESYAGGKGPGMNIYSLSGSPSVYFSSWVHARGAPAYSYDVYFA